MYQQLQAVEAHLTTTSYIMQIVRLELFCAAIQIWLQVVYPINMLYWGPLGVWAYWCIVVKPSREKPKDNSHGGACHEHSAQRPMWQSVAVSVAHCGAGCVLGDIVADWIVYGAGWIIAGRRVWLEMIWGYGLALLFGIAF